MNSEHPLLTASAQTRLEQTVASIRSSQQVWILKDEHGCVMLTTEDEEDGVPVWPDKTLAQYWATEDWSHCEAMAVSLQDWQQKWVDGLSQDDLGIIICPVPGEDGEVLSSEEFADMLFES